ncbi:MAG: amino acid racemase [Lachnospiraceae bacterium]|jgi:aspartate racemase|nr:amino acid racemase [Lachnospiraceae bacterium]MDD3617457.1 amino acid racemase [Lachnospiraceae bacterium]
MEHLNIYKTIGIIGGMGPAATCDLMKKIIRHTNSPDDQHHLHICVDSNTNIPDRTAAIIHHGKSPVPELVKSAIRLQSLGADILVMPCNTAHYFYQDIVSYLDVPLIHMPDETSAYLKKNQITRVGVLATDGTIQSKVYDKSLKQYAIEPVYPTDKHQEIVMSLIYDYVKKGIVSKEDLPDKEIRDILADLRNQGAQKIILACTELPIAFKSLGISQNQIDPTDILAQAAIQYAGAQIIMNAVG